MKDEGWSDLKVSFDAEDEAPLWDAPLSTWPSGWELCETDASGARLVAVFRVNHLPTSSETRAVASAIRRISAGGRLSLEEEVERLRTALRRSSFLLSRAADACSEGDLSDPRIDDLSTFAVEIERLCEERGIDC